MENSRVWADKGALVSQCQPPGLQQPSSKPTCSQSTVMVAGAGAPGKFYYQVFLLQSLDTKMGQSRAFREDYNFSLFLQSSLTRMGLTE